MANIVEGSLDYRRSIEAKSAVIDWWSPSQSLILCQGSGLILLRKLSAFSFLAPLTFTLAFLTVSIMCFLIPFHLIVDEDGVFAELMIQCLLLLEFLTLEVVHVVIFASKLLLELLNSLRY